MGFQVLSSRLDFARFTYNFLTGVLNKDMSLHESFLKNLKKQVAFTGNSRKN